MLIIFVFFSVILVILVGCFAVAVVNVVIRRESAYLVEERIKVAVHARKEPIDSVKDGVHACPESRLNSLQPIGDLGGLRLSGLSNLRLSRKGWSDRILESARILGAEGPLALFTRLLEKLLGKRKVALPNPRKGIRFAQHDENSLAALREFVIPAKIVTVPLHLKARRILCSPK